MSKVSKEFWVSDNDFKKIVKYKETSVVLRCKDESKFEGLVEKAVHKITISYEIDREVTVRESDFEKYLQEWDLNTPGIRVTDYLKNRIFGGGEND